MKKLSEINLDKETAVRFLKRRGPIVLPFTVFVAFFAGAIWSLIFISQAINKAFQVDEKKISGEVPKIDIEAYNRLKDKWKDFQNGKYAGSVNAAPLNTNINSNESNVNTQEININQ